MKAYQQKREKQMQAAQTKKKKHPLTISERVALKFKEETPINSEEQINEALSNPLSQYMDLMHPELVKQAKEPSYV